MSVSPVSFAFNFYLPCYNQHGEWRMEHGERRRELANGAKNGELQQSCP